MKILKNRLGGGLFSRIKQSPLLITLGIFILLLSIIGMSYALWYYTDYQKTENIVTLDCFHITMNETTGTNIKLQNAFPLTNAEGEKLTPYEFTITNSCPGYASYEVQIEVRNSSTLDSKYLKAKLNSNSTSILTSYSESTKLIEKDTDEGYILDTGYLDQNESKKYELRLWLDEKVTTETLNEDESQVQNSSWAGVITLRAAYATEIPKKTLVDTILALPKATEGNGLYEVDHKNDGTELSSEWTATPELRYAGKNPNNYVTFNGETAGWRIIGLVNVLVPQEDGTSKVEQRVKLIRANPIEADADTISGTIDKFSWDSSKSEVNSGWGVNEWSQADLKTLLNDYYYNSLDEKTCYNGQNETSIPCDFGSTRLKAEAKSMIDESIIWNTGANVTSDYTSASNGLAKHFYQYERSSNTGKICTTGDYCDEEPRTTEWSKTSDSGYHGIGLMYPSDYGYATSGNSESEETNRAGCLAKEMYNWRTSNDYSDCAENDWLKPSEDTGYYWTISPRAYSLVASDVFSVNSGGYVICNGASSSYAVLPVVYLSPSVLVYEGNGSYEIPYILEL